MGDGGLQILQPRYTHFSLAATQTVLDVYDTWRLTARSIILSKSKKRNKACKMHRDYDFQISISTLPGAPKPRIVFMCENSFAKIQYKYVLPFL